MQQFLKQSCSTPECIAPESFREFKGLQIVFDRNDPVQTDFAAHDAGGKEAKLIRQKAAVRLSSLVPVDCYESTVFSTLSFNESCLISLVKFGNFC
mmetsp:Transcript_27693/g.54361  ORF Transcript_27693/g.54361 Transcript_27693/m.54361 type:complete len:96 (+) Transcript_27693:148-435(+)